MKKALSILRKLGLDEYAIKLYFILLGKKYGLKVSYIDNLINIIDSKSNRKIIVSLKNLPYLIDVVKQFNYFFGIVIPEKKGSELIVNYSEPKLHTLSTSNVEFRFSSFPESDDVTQIYIDKSGIKPGNIVMDFGFFCGSTVFSFSKAVGKNGKVFAVEPDKINFECLSYNINKHNLLNVIAINKAIWSSTTTLQFQAEGNLGSAVAGVSSRENKTVNVEATSFNDILSKYNVDKVDFIKMDIEGSEVEVIKSMKEYLRMHRTPMIIEVHKDHKDVSTKEALEPIFKEINYYIEYIEQKGTELQLMFVR